MNDNKLKIIISVALLALALGLVGGYFYGNSAGEKTGLAEGVLTGRQQILDEQKKAQEEALKQAQEAANPFSDIETVNPFKDAYKNPFAQ